MIVRVGHETGFGAHAGTGHHLVTPHDLAMTGINVENLPLRIGTGVVGLEVGLPTLSPSGAP